MSSTSSINRFASEDPYAMLAETTKFATFHELEAHYCGMGKFFDFTPYSMKLGEAYLLEVFYDGDKPLQEKMDPAAAKYLLIRIFEACQGAESDSVEGQVYIRFSAIYQEALEEGFFKSVGHSEIDQVLSTRTARRVDETVQVRKTKTFKRSFTFLEERHLGRGHLFDFAAVGLEKHAKNIRYIFAGMDLDYDSHLAWARPLLIDVFTAFKTAKVDTIEGEIKSKLSALFYEEYAKCQDGIFSTEDIRAIRQALGGTKITPVKGPNGSSSGLRLIAEGAVLVLAIYLAYRAVQWYRTPKALPEKV